MTKEQEDKLKKCQGCYNDGGDKLICYIQARVIYANKKYDCPCFDCIVKPICTSICDRRTRVYKFAIEGYHRDRHYGSLDEKRNSL